MYLPKSMLDQVAYYEKRVVTLYDGYSTHITIHFKQWWKRSKTFKFKWFCKFRSGDWSSWESSDDAAKLEVQLIQHFKDKGEL